MYARFGDDLTSANPLTSQRRGHKPYRNDIRLITTTGLRLVALVTVCLFAGSANAQDAALEATVEQVEENRQWIHLPVNKSVVVKTNLPAVRQQTLSPEIAQIQSISPTQVLITGQSFGRTQVIIWSADGQQQIFDVSVELELDLLKEAIRRVDPLARVEAHPILETVILSGTVSDADAADRIMQIAQIFANDVQNHLQVAGEQQVMLRCMVAEMSRSAGRSLGINGYLFGENFRDFPIVNNIGGINPTAINRPEFPVGADAPLIAPEVLTGSTATMIFGIPRLQTQIFMQAMVDNGLLRVMAEPNLVTISGRAASFLAGGEFPYPVPQTGGTGATQTITLQYREFGVRLAFLPIVLANQMIRLNVAPEVSELDFSEGVQISGFFVPGINSRRVETTVEIGSGQTLAVAGLLSESTRAQATRVPGLGELPVLGSLFRSVSYQKDLTDLIIMVTPEIVAPIDPTQAGDLPGRGHVDPDDWQLYFLGLIEGSIDEEAAEMPNEVPAGDDSAQQEPSMESGEVDSGLFGPWGMSELEDYE